MVDVIIPVFNAFEDLERCLASVESHRGNTTFRLVLINDASTDARIAPLLQRLEQRPWTDTLVLTNEHNLGFVQTVNRAMALGMSDVVLLNSDTMVTAGWLDQLMACAAADPRIATVTPFSNNGEICSYPVFCHATPAASLDADAIAAAMASLPEESPCTDLPTGVGFCMFIRRLALNQLGLFDAEHFGTGYGEENDFCRRAHAAGWRNVLCPRAYVLHVGGSSFQSQSNAFKANNLKVLLQRHPDYEEVVRNFIDADPVRPLREAVRERLAAKQRDISGHPARAGWLLVTHHLGGGVEKHVQDMVALLSKHVRVEVLRPWGAHGVQLQDSHGNTLTCDADSSGTFATMLTELLHSRGYVRMHIHHLHGFGAEVMPALQALNLPYDLTLHDFGIYCPQYALSTPDGDYCGEPNLAGCEACVALRPHPWQLSVAEWRARWGQFARGAQRVYAPSYSVREKVAQHLPTLDITVLPHPPRRDWLTPHAETVKVLILGGLSRTKGLNEIVACAEHAKAHKLPLAFVVLGYPEHAVPVWPDLPLQVRGEYPDADLPRLARLERADLVCFPGRIPETYSYTLDVALSLNLPIVATNTGAIAERLKHHQNARLVPVHAPADVFNQAFLAAAPDKTLAPWDATSQVAARHQHVDLLLQPLREAPANWPVVEPLSTLNVRQQPVAQVAGPDLPLLALFEHGVECGHLNSRAALKQRLVEVVADQSVLQRLEQRTGQRWYEAINELDGLRETQTQLRETIQATEQQLAGAQARIEELLTSTSWRVTAPIRNAKELWKNRVAPGVYKLRKAQRLAAKWPLAWRIFREHGLRGLLQRVRRKLSPPTPPSRPTLAPPLVSIAALHLETCPAERTPKVSIVIPSYGQHQHTFNCLVSLRDHTHLADVEVIVVDDCFSDPLAQALAQTTGARFVRNPQNLGFIGSCREGAALARGEFILLLNNDVQVCAGWLQALLDVFDQRSDAGLVGARLVYPDGSLQEAGGIVWRDGSAWNWGRGLDPEHPYHRYLRPVDYCSGACLLLRHDDWRTLGGFDPAYMPAYYEDTDLAMRVRAMGKQVYYQPEALIVHHEGISSGTDLSQGVKKHQVINQKTFFERWRDTLAMHRMNGVEPRREADRHAKGWFLVVEACMIAPDEDSGSVRMLAMLELLVELGYKVAFVADNLEYRQPYVRQLQQRGVEVWHGPHLASVAQLLEREGRYFSHIMFCRHYIAAPYMQDVRRWAPQAKILFDSVDLHYLREQRMAELEKDGHLLKLSEKTREQELGVIRQADVTLVVSPVEKTLLATETPDARVEVLSNIHEPVAHTPGFDGRDGLLFVGGFQHPPNVDAVRWFLEEVWPIVHQQAPHITVRIVGSKMPDSLKALAGKGIEILGFVADLDPLLASSRMSIAPLRYGAGVKGKVNQAMAHGLPVVATQAAVEGMFLQAGTEVLVAQDAQAFAQAVLQLDSDRALWETLAAGGKHNIERTFSREVARRALQAVL